MRIEQLEYVISVTQHGSLRRASERLHISQPALSEAVSNLERELGVTLLDRRRTGARISSQGRDLLQKMADVLEAVDDLRTAAGDQRLTTRTIRVGTVNTGTSVLLVPTIRDFSAANPGGVVEVVNTQQSEIYQGLAEGTLDLGLVNLLPGDDVPPQLTSVDLLRGRPVVCCRADHPMAGREALSVADLLDQPFVLMRSGYLMNRFVHRIFGGALPAHSYTTDGAEMGKLMVAEGLGVTVLPDYSIDRDPLVLAGIITYRPLADNSTGVKLVLLSRRVEHVPQGVRELQSRLVAQARRHMRQTRLARRPTVDAAVQPGPSG